MSDCPPTMYSSTAAVAPFLSEQQIFYTQLIKVVNEAAARYQLNFVNVRRVTVPHWFRVLAGRPEIIFAPLRVTETGALCTVAGLKGEFSSRQLSTTIRQSWGIKGDGYVYGTAAGNTVALVTPARLNDPAATGIHGTAYYPWLADRSSWL